MIITNILRKNIGTITAALGFLLLCILTFGDLGELATEAYWHNVLENLTAISFVSIGLTLIQVAIKQGLAEQALQYGLNTQKTAEKYDEHKSLIKSCAEKMIYLPYFLQIYNRRHTALRKQEFLINNGFVSEQSLMLSDNRKLIRDYQSIITNITAGSIKWSTVDIVYNKYGRIITLNEHRTRRVFSAIVSSLSGMVGITFLTGGLFFTPSTEPLWEKFVKLFTYIIVIAIGGIFTVIKEYEKGAFSVPNELDEINQIWTEFIAWSVPTWVVSEVAKLNGDINGEKEVADGQTENADDGRTTVQEKQEPCQDVQDIDTDSVVQSNNFDTGILPVDGAEQCRQCDGDFTVVG